MYHLSFFVFPLYAPAVLACGVVMWKWYLIYNYSALGPAAIRHHAYKSDIAHLGVL